MLFRVVWIEVQGGGNAAAAQTLIADLAKELLKEHLVHNRTLSGPLRNDNTLEPLVRRIVCLTLPALTNTFGNLVFATSGY